MPSSMDEGKGWMREQIRRLDPKLVLDVGVGQGTYFDLVAAAGQHWTAIEIWEPYIERFALRDRYEQVLVEDVRLHDWSDDAWDLVIFGDVVEHMTRAEALAVWNAALAHSTYVLLSIPIVFMPQGAAEGNPFEVHVETWTHEQCMALPGVVEHQRNPSIGCYLARGLG